MTKKPFATQKFCNSNATERLEKKRKKKREKGTVPFSLFLW
jgi:hypothetical protein